MTFIVGGRDNYVRKEYVCSGVEVGCQIQNNSGCLMRCFFTPHSATQALTQFSSTNRTSMFSFIYFDCIVYLSHYLSGIRPSVVHEKISAIAIGAFLLNNIAFCLRLKLGPCTHSSLNLFAKSK